jgi:hypothetical protein
MVDEFSVDFRVDPPDGLTKGGAAKTFRTDTLNKILASVQTATDARAAALKEEILLSYTRWSSGTTAQSVRSDTAQLTGNGVEGGLSIGPSPALRFITTAGGGVVLPRTVIEPTDAPKLAFIGRKGKVVLQSQVTHPGFTEIGDPIAVNIEALRQEVEQAVIDSVKDSTIEWVDGMNNETGRNLRRQYRYSRPAGR